MKMKALMLTAVLALSSMSALAEQITLDANGLTEEQKAQLALQAAQMKTAPANTQGTSAAIRQEAEAWGELGANMGRAAVGAAKELGVAANDFIQTPAGKVTMGVVVYKLIGKDILGIIIGLGILFVGYVLAFWLFFRAKFASFTKYEVRPILWGMMNKKYLVEFREDDNNQTWRVVLAVASVVLSTIVGLVTIF